MSGEELKLLDTARRNVRTFINGATFKCRADQEAALACVDVLESHIQDQSNLIAILRDVVAIDAHPVSSPPQNDAGVDWICNGIPDEVIEAGCDAWDRARQEMEDREASDQPEAYRDWDDGMIVAAIFKAMSAALRTPMSELQALGQEFEAGWQPIETAPKDDEPRLVRGRDWGMPNGRIHYNVAIWNHVFNEWRSADEPEQALAYLTDWLPGTPLPSAPSGEG